jgi:hypothetical protein
MSYMWLHGDRNTDIQDKPKVNNVALYMWEEVEGPCRQNGWRQVTEDSKELQTYRVKSERNAEGSKGKVAPMLN